MSTVALLMTAGGCAGEVPAGNDAPPSPPSADGAVGPVADAAPVVPDAAGPGSCEFDYETQFSLPPLPVVPPPPWDERRGDGPDGAGLPPADGDPLASPIAHAEPRPPFTFHLRPIDPPVGPAYIVMPGYSDDMPLFARGKAWTTAERCYETPLGVLTLTEDEAFDLYRRIAELTTGSAMNVTTGRRNVVGVRGSYPGRLAWHDNRADRFNDTIVLLWIDSSGAKHVREFPVTTDVGEHDFGTNSSSFLRPNRRYRYLNGWHRGYNALAINQSGYRVRDDSNHNGHWDSDRNGWRAPSTPLDHDRTGAGHNIHMGSVDAPLGTAAVDVWSAGCQVIPGMANWTEFIERAWTGEGDAVDYFLIDVRDLDPRVWGDCVPDGTHACPFPIDAFPFVDTRDTSGLAERVFDVYNCSAADEGGPEVVYFFTTASGGALTASVDDVDGDAIDLDVHLLDGDDPDACLARSNVSVSSTIGPGRYFLVVDTYVEGGAERVGPYTLRVNLE